MRADLLVMTGVTPSPHYHLSLSSVLSDVDTNAGIVKPESGTVEVGSTSREGQYSEQYWSPQYGLTTPHYHNTIATDQLQDGEEDSGDHYRDSTGPIRGYPGARSDAFVWRPY